MANHFRRLTAIAFIRAEMITWDAKNMVQLALSRNIRKGETEISDSGKSIQVWNPDQKIWGNGLRTLFDNGGNIIVEKGRRSIKRPRPWVRNSSGVAIRDDGSDLKKDDADLPGHQKTPIESSGAS